MNAVANLSGNGEVLVQDILAPRLNVALEAISDIYEGEGFTLLTELGLSKEFLESAEHRVLDVLMHSGLPKTSPCSEDVCSVGITGQVLSYSMIASEDDGFRFIAIGCTDSTHMVVVRGRLKFTFYVPQTSVGMRDALYVLLQHNLLKGPRLYEKTATIIKQFFPRMLQCVFEDYVKMEMVITTFDGLELPCKVYFDPDKLEDSAISIAGWVYHFDMGIYPKEQLGKTVWYLEREARGIESRDRRKTPRNEAGLSFSEKQNWVRVMQRNKPILSNDPLAGSVIEEHAMVPNHVQ